MKAGILLLLCAPLLALAAQNRFGQMQPGAGRTTGAADCPQQAKFGPGSADCPGGAGFGRNGADCVGQAGCPLVTTAITSPTTLPASEIVAAVEEERVAHDLYVAAAARWNLPVFSNIAAAEVRHAAAITQLATASGTPLPAANTGVYATPELQAMYTQLLALVNQSETGALGAGALVEETDIADLRRMIAMATDSVTRTILSNLERASANHLRAFVHNLSVRGVTYEPKVLTPEEYKALIDS